MNPIIRWAGSKAKLLKQIHSLKPVKFRRLLEPFAGSACLFFSLEPTDAVISDVNSELMDVYTEIRDDPLAVHQFLESIPRTKEAYYRLREIDVTTLGQAERAARFIFLMKGCFNGVYRTNRQGKFNVPFGTEVYLPPTYEQLTAVSRLLAKNQVLKCDYSTTLGLAKKNDWVYLDPPYRSSRRFSGEYGYSAAFSDDNLDALAAHCHKLSEQGVQIMISHVHDDQFLKLFPRWNIWQHSISRTVAGKHAKRVQVNEVILTNYSTSLLV